MNENKLGRRWWRQKRWSVGLATLLVLAYPASLGPVNYAVARGWVSPRARTGLDAVYAPFDSPAFHDLPGAGWLTTYTVWWFRLGFQQANPSR